MNYDFLSIEISVENVQHLLLTTERQHRAMEIYEPRIIQEISVNVNKEQHKRIGQK